MQEQMEYKSRDEDALKDAAIETLNYDKPKKREYTKDDIVVSGRDTCKSCSGKGYLVMFQPGTMQRKLIPCDCIMNRFRKLEDKSSLVFETLVVDDIQKLVIVPK